AAVRLDQTEHHLRALGAAGHRGGRAAEQLQRRHGVGVAAGRAHEARRGHVDREDVVEVAGECVAVKHVHHLPPEGGAYVSPDPNRGIRYTWTLGSKYATKLMAGAGGAGPPGGTADNSEAISKRVPAASRRVRQDGQQVQFHVNSCEPEHVDVRIWEG